MTNNPKVSVYILAYKHAKYIKKSLDSVLNQKTKFKFEVIVGDDCSNDGTEKILVEYKNRYPEILKYIINDQNVGAARNSYNLQLLAKGEYVCALEGDDFWTDDYKLQKQCDFLDKHKDCFAVGGNTVDVDVNGLNPEITMLKWQTSKYYTINDYLKYGMVIHGSTIMMRNQFPLSSENFKKMRLPVKTMSDVINRVLIYKMGRLYCMPDVFHAHRCGDSVITSYSYTQKSKAIEYTKMYIKIVNALERYYDNSLNLKPLIANRIAYIRLESLLKHTVIDIKEYDLLISRYPTSFRFLIWYKIIQKMIRKVIHKMATKFFCVRKI